MTDTVVQLQHDDREQRTAVILPCSPDQFSQFIASLLGRPQELTGLRQGQFLADKAEAIQLYDLITQRVLQQHGVHPLQFTVRVKFDNGTSVLLNSVEEFNAYHEVRSVRSLGMLLTWTFLVSFPGKASPEKQEIEFGYMSELRGFVEMDGELVHGGEGFVHYRIRHTARTWGADIEALLAHYMDTLIKPEPKFRAILRKNSVTIGVTVGLLLFIMLMGGLGWVNSQIFDRQSALLLPALGDAVTASKKLDQIITYLNVSREGVRSLYTTLYMLFSLAGSVFVGIRIGMEADTYPPSDVILTKRAETVYQERQKAYQNSVRRLVISTVAAVLVGILSNIAYDFLVKDAIEKAVKKRAEAARIP